MINKFRSIFIDICGVALSDEDRALLQHAAVAGVVFFSRNFESPDQLKALIDEIRGINPALLFAVDQEGGRVQRFKEGFTRIAPMGEFEKEYKVDQSAALKKMQDVGFTLASELKSIGIDISFAPVLDLNRGLCDVVGDRAFSSDPQIVIALASALTAGFNQAGVQAVGKHFPGHGHVAVDSHVGIPIDDRELGEVLASDILPFKAMIGSGLQAIMPAHIIFPKVDVLPACFSKVWLTDILKNQCGFKGQVFSDDMSMEGAKAVGNLEARTNLALEAGCDYVLVCNDRPGVVSLLKE